MWSSKTKILATRAPPSWIEFDVVTSQHQTQSASVCECYLNRLLQTLKRFFWIWKEINIRRYMEINNHNPYSRCRVWRCERNVISWCASFVIVAMSVEFNKDFSLSPNIISSNMAIISVIWISWDWLHTTNCTAILSKSKSPVHLHQYEFQYLIIFNLKYIPRSISCL